MIDSLSKRERAKYELIWQRGEYRRKSPGMLDAPNAFAAFKMKAGDTLLDAGAGTCRATVWFRDQGLTVLAIDLAGNAREDITVPFFQETLWALSDRVTKHDYVYCCDVMEHIPPERVEGVLKELRRVTGKWAWFRICKSPDEMGALIGQPLHLTCRNAKWWSNELKKQYKKVEMLGEGKKIVVFQAGV